MEAFPSNSHEQRVPRAEEPAKKPELKVVEKVIDGPVVRRKKSLGARIREMLFDGREGVLEYVIQDVLVPAFKDTISDAVSTGVERLVFGEDAKTRPRRSSNRSSVFGNNSGNHTNYTRYSSSSSRPDNVRQLPRRSRASHEFDEIILATRVEAENILNGLNKLVNRYGMVSVRELYEMVGEPFHHTDEKWGWTDLSDAGYKRVSNGFMLVLPRTEALDEE
jgi:hypothetical protein